MVITYILKSALVLVILYGVFFFALQRETFHRFNRCVVLASVVFSMVAPCLHLAVPDRLPLVGAVHGMADRMVALDDIVVTAHGAHDASGVSGLTLLGWLQCIYLVGVAFMVVRLVVQAVLLARNLSLGARCSDGCGNTVVLKSGNVPPYSIFRYIVMSVADYEHHRRSILTHEQEHIRLHHTLDKLLMEAAKVLQWFNPAVWLFARDLDALHEYEADEAVINKGIDAKTYQTLLVVKAVGNRLQPFANNLNRGSLKQRIVMMNKKKSSPWTMLKALFIVPAAAVAVSAFAVDNASVEPSAVAELGVQAQRQAKKVSPVRKAVVRKQATGQAARSSAAAKKQTVGRKTAAAKAGNRIYDVCEQMPEYPGGNAALREFLGKTVKYPASAAAAKKEGRAVVKFVVEPDGNISNIEIARSAGDEALDAEALRVVKAMPKWTPGTQGGKTVRVRFMVPFNFSRK